MLKKGLSAVYSSIIFEDGTVAQFLNKFRAFCGIGMLIIVLTKAHHFPISFVST
jgi:preprotein translocase subunit SecG